MKLAPYILYVIVRIFYATYRFNIVNQEAMDQVKASSKYGNYLFALWHQNHMLALLAHLKTPHAIIVSASKDGQLVARVIELFGFIAPRGSSSRGGSSALKGMIRLIKTGIPTGITVDGPRGPIYEPKKGVFELSLLTETPILPLSVYPDKYWQLKSWDKFRIPKPFSTIHVFYGKSFLVTKKDKEDDFKTISQDLKQQLFESENVLQQNTKKA